MKPFKFLSSLMLTIVSVLFVSSQVSQATGLPMTGVSGTMGALTIFMQSAAPGTLMTTTVSTPAKHIGPYITEMFLKVLNGMDVTSQNRVIRNASRKGTALPRLTVEIGARPLDTTITQPTGTQRTLTAQLLKVYDIFKLIRFVPADLKESFGSDMLDPKLEKTPFENWFWKAELEKFAQEMNDNFYFQSYRADAADFDAGATYTAGTTLASYIKFTDKEFYRCVTNTSAGESPTTHPAKWSKATHLVQYNGTGTLIAAYITAGDIPAGNVVASGSNTTSNALENIQKVYDAMPVALQNKGGKVKISYALWAKYLVREQAVYPYVNNQGMGDAKKYVYRSGEKWEIVPCTWMGTSERIIFDVENKNITIGTNLVGENAPAITPPDQDVHGATYAAKCTFGSEIADPSQLWVGDQS